MRLNAIDSVTSLVLCTAMLGASTLHATPTAQSVRSADAYAVSAPPVVLTQLAQNDALAERIIGLRDLLIDEDIDGFWQAVADVPEIGDATEAGQFRNIMFDAVWSNDLELITWLNETCPDCAIRQIGDRLINDLGILREGTPWRGINFVTFKYLYDNGAVDRFQEQYPGRSVVAHVAAHWIPSADGIYSDYVVTMRDRINEPGRNDNKRKMLSYLFENGHDVNEADAERGTTALFVAVRNQDRPLAEFLVANGADPMIGRNPLGGLSGSTSPEFLKWLLELGLDPNTVTAPFHSGRSTVLLGRIVQRGDFNPALLEILEAHGLDVNAVDSSGKTAIDYAVHEFGRSEQPFTDYLLARGAVKTDRFHYATLIHAIRRRDAALLEQIISKHPHLVNGAEFDEDNYPLEQALFAGDVDVFEILLDAGANLDGANKFRTDYLAGALSRQNYSLAKLILERVPTVPVNRTIRRDDATFEWSGALEHASADGNMEWVQLLLDRGAVMTGHELRLYPIYGAAFNQHMDVVRTLLEAGSPANPRDVKTGETLIEVLESHDGYDEIIALLRSYEP